MLSVDSLVSYAMELEAENAGSGLQWLTDQRTSALAKMDAGGTYDYISTSVNGQTFSRRVTATTLEWFEALQLAISEMKGTRVRIVYSNFSGIPH